jgi:hypothetical protein
MPRIAHPRNLIHIHTQKSHPAIIPPSRPLHLIGVRPQFQMHFEVGRKNRGQINRPMGAKRP